VTGAPSSVGAVAGQGVLGIALKDDTTTESDIDTMREAKSANFVVYSPYGKATVSNYWKKSNIFPGDGTYSTASAVNTNPTEETMFNVFVTGIVSTVEPGAFNAIVTIDYTVEFFELKDLGQS